MNVHTLYKLKQLLRGVKPWYFLVAAAITGLVCIYALRQNNVEMVRLREAVYQADEANGDVRGALTALQRHVTAHMNTDLTAGPNAVSPPIQLRYTYERLLQASQQSASNEQLYSEAQAHCERLNSSDFSGRNRVPCIQEYVTSRGGSTAPAVSESLYKYDFVSPTWSPDLAGWSLVLTAGLLLAALDVWVLKRWLRKY